MTQLKEEIAGLQKRLVNKDRELLEKDKQVNNFNFNFNFIIFNFIIFAFLFFIDNWIKR